MEAKKISWEKLVKKEKSKKERQKKEGKETTGTNCHINAQIKQEKEKQEKHLRTLF